MKLKIEITPNKNIVKFVAPSTLVEGSYEITDMSQAGYIPIAQELLQLPFITNIFITANFIAVQKNDMVEWDMVLDEVKELIEDELLANPSVILQPRYNPISVYVERTPNNSVMKFVTNRILIEGIIELKNIHEAKEVPLAQFLFSFPYVKEVFISDNFVSITKIDEFNWEDISMEIRYNISEYIKEEKEISNIKNFSTYKSIDNSEKKFSEIEIKIKNILDEYVLPAITGDGGNIELISFDEKTKIAKMLLQGACNGCPSSTFTLKNGIEELLKQMLPNEIEAVEAING
ncbi:Fe-S cluster biogenesis protein NfuA, 4Fe-4S-binding domain [Apibacter mensalis]|uniref:Fe-S cluster biogenesis protein NfuA, 4Fe-4S-binding domain n=1 Tax=Apibacter mensalis TaxID=1586267 RepID=A0A0X3ARE5_9FLAO|nr:NifU family protein [Apibacter mensalis]CVK16971.1 Fe-S cluster biogenesis protein NfuA, 4Fe-4S-binding domain [Apibacter mensalis]